MSILNEEGLIRTTRVKTAKAAIESLKKHMTEENKDVTLAVISFYNHLIFRLGHTYHEQSPSRRFENQKLEIKLRPCRPSATKSKHYSKSGKFPAICHMSFANTSMMWKRPCLTEMNKSKKSGICRRTFFDYGRWNST